MRGERQVSLTQKHVAVSVDAHTHLEMHGITRYQEEEALTHKQTAVSVDPQGNLELLGTAADKDKTIVGLDVMKREEVADSDSGACSEENTVFSNAGTDGRENGRTYYLDRHIVDCGSNRVMKQWKMKRQGNDIRIQYECGQIPDGVEQNHT